MSNRKRTARPKRTPQRTCIACREVGDKRSLVRLVRTADGILVDPSGKLAGRGAYVHWSKECWARLSKQDAILARALKTEITAADRARLAQFGSQLPDANGE